MDIKSTPIDALNLSTRSYNCLRRNGVCTIGELVALSEEEIFSMKNLGKKSAEEVFQKINEYYGEPDRDNEDTEQNDPVGMIKLSALSDDCKKAVTDILSSRNVKISDIDPLPSRAYNRLMINGFIAFSEIVFMDEDDLMTIPGMDRETASCIEKCCMEYLKNDNEIINIIGEISNVSKRDLSEADIMHIRTDSEYVKCFKTFFSANDMDIIDLDLPNRAKNVLLKYGYKKLSDIISLSENTLMDLKGMTHNSVHKILSLFSVYLNENRDRLIAVCRGDISAVWDEKTLAGMILRLYEADPFCGYNFSEITTKLDIPESVSGSLLKKVLGRMISEKKLEYVDYRCYRVYPKFSEYLNGGSEVNEKNRSILQKKLDGVTLEAIANENGLTRERIRQLILKTVREIKGKYSAKNGVVVFDEDYYRYFFETYAVEKNDAEKWFGITPYMNNYFEVTGSKHGSEPLQKALEDMTLGAGMRLRVKKYINRNRIYADGMYIEKRRADIEEFVVRKYCTDNVSFTEFVRIYNDFLREMEIPFDEDIYYTEDIIRTRKNRLSDVHFLLWKLNEQIRYYDVDGKDYTELLDTLDLDAYKDIELSTAKFMETYPEIMEKYDIRDQYELHNLLRKIIPEGRYPELSFGRMPELKFGTFDRTAALFDLLIDYSPISADDLADIIHKEYGYDQSTIIFTYLQPFSQYYHEGIYSVNFNDIPPERKASLKAALTEDFYYISEIRNIFSSMYPDGDMEQINPRTLKSMGFIVLSRYAVQNFSTLDAYYEDMFTKEDIVDVGFHKKRHATVQMFWQKLYNLKCSLDVIEFEHDRIINFRRLEAMGISKDDLKAFCGRVYDFAQENTYFTIQSIRQAGFDDELFELGFGDLFYANLLLSDNRISNMKMMGNIILYKGDIKISFRSFVTDIIGQHGSIDIIDLENELKDLYGCEFERHDLTFKTKNSEVYYDDILKRFYANEDMYYSELDEPEEY